MPVFQESKRMEAFFQMVSRLEQSTLLAMSSTRRSKNRGSIVLSTLSNEVCALLGFYVAYNGIFLQTFLDNLSGPIFKGEADGTDRLSRNVGNKLPFYTV